MNVKCSILNVEVKEIKKENTTASQYQYVPNNKATTNNKPAGRQAQTTN
jgi:hypothetical protein